MKVSIIYTMKLRNIYFLKVYAKFYLENQIDLNNPHKIHPKENAFENSPTETKNIENQECLSILDSLCSSPR